MNRKEIRTIIVAGVIFGLTAFSTEAQNVASGNAAAILGGTNNTASGTRSTIVGGNENQATPTGSTIVAGVRQYQLGK